MKALIRFTARSFVCLAFCGVPLATLNVFAQSIAKPSANGATPRLNPYPVKPKKTPTALATPDDPRAGNIHALDNDRQYFYEVELQRELTRLEGESHTVTITSADDKKVLMIAAPSANKSLHFPSAYLLGRTPYRVTERWMPLYIISERIHYQHDDKQFPGREEVWLTTMQTWKQAKGDCEDHAILLADWLIELGLDARVVLGKHNDSGHAWVVVIKDGNEYLLEATLKHYLERWAAYPLTKMLPDYHPKIMFNRDDLWVNSGSTLTTSYSNKKWKKTLHFSPTQ